MAVPAFANGGMNVTGLRLVDFTDPTVKSYLQGWSVVSRNVRILDGSSNNKIIEVCMMSGGRFSNVRWVESYAAFHWARKLVFSNSYFRVGSQGARRIPSFPLGNTTSDFSGMIFPTGKLVNTSFRAQWNAALDHSVCRVIFHRYRTKKNISINLSSFT